MHNIFRVPYLLLHLWIQPATGFFSLDQPSNASMKPPHPTNPPTLPSYLPVCLCHSMSLYFIIFSLSAYPSLICISLPLTVSCALIYPYLSLPLALSCSCSFVLLLSLSLFNSLQLSSTLCNSSSTLLQLSPTLSNSSPILSNSSPTLSLSLSLVVVFYSPWLRRLGLALYRILEADRETRAEYIVCIWVYIYIYVCMYIYI